MLCDRLPAGWISRTVLPLPGHERGAAEGPLQQGWWSRGHWAGFIHISRSLGKENFSRFTPLMFLKRAVPRPRARAHSRLPQVPHAPELSAARLVSDLWVQTPSASRAKPSPGKAGSLVASRGFSPAKRNTRAHSKAGFAYTLSSYPTDLQAWGSKNILNY